MDILVLSMLFCFGIGMLVADSNDTIKTVILLIIVGVVQFGSVLYAFYPITKAEIDSAIQVCENNGGLNNINNERYVCKNGVKFEF